MIYKIFLLILIIFLSSSLAVFATASEEPLAHLYDNITIRDVNAQSDKIIVYKSKFIRNPVRSDLPKIPKMITPLWVITAKDLHISEEACLAIDASLCREASGSSTHQCYDNCITNGPKFIEYDEKSGILYMDAGTDISGTGGVPRFLFSANINNKQIKYLNTIVAPYKAYLSPKGKYLALESGWDDIVVCNTQSGSLNEIHGENILSDKNKYTQTLSFIRWLNDKELEYDEIEKNNYSSPAKTNIFNIESNKVTTLVK